MTARSKLDQLKRRLRLTRDGVRCPECGRAGPEERGAMYIPEEANPDERAELIALFNQILDVAQRVGCKETFCRCGRQRQNSALFMQNCSDATWEAIEAVNRRIHHKMGRRTPYEIAIADAPSVTAPPQIVPDNDPGPGAYDDD